MQTLTHPTRNFSSNQSFPLFETVFIAFSSSQRSPNMAEAATRDSGDLRRQFSEALAHVPGLKRQKTRAGETFLVSFDGPDDEENPQNWAWKTK